MSGIIYQSVTLAPTSDWHTYTTRPATQFPAIHTVSCRDIIQTGYFHATTGEAQEADYESESWNLPGAVPSALGREQPVGEYHLLLQPASSQPPSSPAVSCPPATDPLLLLHSTRWSFCLCLWNKSAHFTKEAETVYFYWGLWLLRGSKYKHAVFIAEKLQCGLRHSGWKPPGKQSERKMLKEDRGMRTESQHWHGAEGETWTVKMCYWQSKKCQELTPDQLSPCAVGQTLCLYLFSATCRI